jgi:hypothetical protein
MELISPLMKKLLNAVTFRKELKKLAESYHEDIKRPKMIDWSKTYEEWGDCENRCARAYCERPGTMKDSINRWICKFHYYKALIGNKEKKYQAKLKKQRKDYRLAKKAKKAQIKAGKKSWRTKRARVEKNKTSKNKTSHLSSPRRNS